MGVGTGDTASREGEQLWSGVPGAESQGQAIPALPILVTAAVGKITALAAVITYKAGDGWSWVKQRPQMTPDLPMALLAHSFFFLPKHSACSSPEL